MNWEQIKTLLILSFLILDIYLVAQFLDKKEQADIGVLEQHQSTIEDQLKAESIKLPELPQEEYEETFISVKQKVFLPDEITLNKSTIAQKQSLITDYFIASVLDKPLEIGKEIPNKQLEEIFSQLVISPEEYKFWNWNEKLNVLMFFQTKMDRPIYFNQNGLVLVFLNDKNEIVYYTQTMLGEADTLAEKRELIKPIRAIETLYNGNELNQGDEITTVNIGFHTRVPFEGGVQVFAPIWKVNVNDEKDFFVNAIEGFTFSTKEEDFLVETIEATLERISAYEKDDKAMKEIEEDMEERIEQLHRGES